LDNLGVQRLLIQTPPQGEAWGAVHDRLARASQPLD
jgi:L-threonylcarbamoyladenylate synthase